MKPPAKKHRSGTYRKFHIVYTKLWFLLFLACTNSRLFSQPLYAEPFTIGTQWVYERVQYMYYLATYDYITFEITDTLKWHDKTAFKIENDIDGGKLYMHVIGDSVYIWLGAMDDYQLMYDFSDPLSLEIPWIGICHTDYDTAVVITDSLSQVVLSHVITKQHNHILNNGTLESDLVINVYDHIGADRFGLRYPLGRGLCDIPGPSISQLRCFTNGDAHFRFVDYPCDSVWTLNTALHNVEDLTTVMYPNPANGSIHFKTDFNTLPYQIVDVTGKLVQYGIIEENRIDILHTGIFFLRIQQDWQVFIAKVFNH